MCCVRSCFVLSCLLCRENMCVQLCYRDPISRMAVKVVEVGASMGLVPVDVVPLHEEVCACDLCDKCPAWLR